MGSVNVNRTVSDQFYRYKMPRLIAKVEGKGNGIKTVIVNMVDIAKALNRPATYPTKYFGCELGAQTKFDYKNDRYIVNGSHDSHKLQDLLDGFIKKFVLCPECNNPETNLIVHPKKQTILQMCTACGYSGHVDMRHKLTTFILKYPPDLKPMSAGTPLPPVIAVSAAAAKEKPKSKRKSSDHGKNGTMSPNEKNGDDSDNEFGASPPGGSDGDDEFDDWAVDTSDAAIAKRMEDLTDGAKGITLNDDLEKTQQERLGLFYNFVKKLLDEGRLEGSDKEILIEAERLDVKEKGLLVLTELLFNENMAQQIKTHRILLLRFTNGNHKSQKYLMGGFEQLVKVYASLMPKVPHLLKALYDADILEEEVLLDWAGKASKKYVGKELNQEIRDRATPFVKWLNEAEEEESDSEEDGENDASDPEDDHIEVVYSDRSVGLQVHVPPPPRAVDAAKNEEDDIDIDAI